MKARFSEEYYRTNWDRFIKETNDGDYINLEHKLQYRMSIYKDLPTDALEKIEKIEAQKIVDDFTGELKKRMKMINDLESGKSSLGYTTKIQEVHEMGRIRQRFEFNCIQLADFKKKYI